MAELIVALDHADAQSAWELVDQLPESCRYKVGSVLFTNAGPGFVRALVTGGHAVFLDLKWHDIPNTVAGAVHGARSLGVDMVTVHASGGAAMIGAAVDAAGDDMAVVAVTVLTSHDRASHAVVTGHDAALEGEVLRLASLAMGAGAQGVVCSPAEVERIRGIVGSGRIVVPGIRRSSDAVGDQQRVGTPEAAVGAGATHLVVGRPITQAAEPGAVYRELVRLARRPEAQSPEPGTAD